MYNANETSQRIIDLEKEYREAQMRKGADSFMALERRVREELNRRATEDDNIYDQEFEDMLEERLAKLDEESRSEFYRIRTNRKNDGILSAKEIDLLTLEAMEKSYYHYMGIEAPAVKYEKKFTMGGCTIQMKK